MHEDDSANALLPGSRLERYELLCPLAKGGMASVWIARQLGKHGFEKIVAIKTILPQFSSDPRFRRMFLDEAHIAAGIEHPNVAQILDLGEQRDLLYIAMEYVDGDALSRLSRAAERKDLAVPTGIVLRILADACGGLHAAHELRGRDGQLLGVVHRDVSPQNVLVSTKGVAKIIDFGVAKARDRLAEDTNAGVLKGKIQYMAPEQAVGKPIDRRADVWAVGAMLYAMLAGKPPFDGPNQLATLHRLTSGKPPMPLPPSVPKPITDVVRAVLTHDPDRRIPTALDLQHALEEAMNRTGLGATHTEVAAFLREHLADRAAARKQAIDLALAAAAERARVAQVLAMPASDSASGVSHPAVTSTQDIPSLHDFIAPQSEPPTAHGGTDAEKPIPIEVVEPATSPRPRWPIVAGAAAALVIAGVVAGAVRGRASPPTPSAPERATPSSPEPMNTAATPASAVVEVVTAAASATAPATAAPTPDPAPAPATSVTSASTTSGSAAKPKASAATTAAPKPSTWKKIDDGF
ncbi:MAG: serine/threonine protein kinase [Deltaproteobacteria bacterium]|nr:serine/threonine protein kinase [Deltaproteobacteria bacterium]